MFWLFIFDYPFQCLVVSLLRSASSRLMCVRGRQDLEIQGPRLNMTKEEKTSVQHGSDRRLEPIITPPMPLLEVCVSFIPKSFSFVGGLKPHSSCSLQAPFI